jgi:steroid 5-alpha reductase family enzyme
MNQEEKRAWLGLPIVMIIAAGLAIAGSQGGAKVSGLPIFVACIVLAFLIQWIAFIPAYLQQTEAFYDLTGSLTFLSVTILAVVLSPVRDARSYLLLALISIWAIRLGSFLFRRVRKAGEDRRFRELKTSFSRFLLTWTLQGLWVSFSLAAALAAITSTIRVEFGWFAWIGLAVWLIGFVVEVVADRQKNQFRENPANQGKFIRSGLWAWSRHPNYFGEIVLWVGIAIIALPTLSGWTWLTLISPIFITLLITRISGVPMLEAQADEKWGGQPDYEAYKRNTSILFLRPPANDS